MQDKLAVLIKTPILGYRTFKTHNFCKNKAQKSEFRFFTIIKTRKIPAKKIFLQKTNQN